MSISLNNHESRIKALENSSGSGSVFVNDCGVIGKATFDMNSFQSDYLWFIQCTIDQSSDYYGARTYNTMFAFKKGVNVPRFYVGGGTDWSENVSCGVANNIASVSTWSGSVVFKQLTATALKLYYNFSYNTYCLIYTFLEFLFKEV